MKKKTQSVQDMHVFATEVVSELSGGEVFGLEGELGTGKTEFVRGLAKALGSKDAVKSPSFTLLNHYRLGHPTIKHLIHVDLYRLEDAGSDLVSQIGLDEWLNHSDAVVCIEWPWEEIRQELPNLRLIKFSYGTTTSERLIEMGV